MHWWQQYLPIFWARAVPKQYATSPWRGPRYVSPVLLALLPGLWVGLTGRS
jgi:hypothetical protein